MEILHKFKKNGYFTAELFYLLSRKRVLDTTDMIIPSEYIRELSMSTVERIQTLSSFEVNNNEGKTTDKMILSLCPKIIIFQNFKPNDKIVAKFSVKNVSKGPTYLNMICKESSYFTVKPCIAQLPSRLAPGISITFTVTFMPNQYEDYTHKVIFHTENHQYTLAIIGKLDSCGVGPRPMFDFPNEVTIPKVPLKLENHIIKMIQNVGVVPAGFTLTTKCPFSVHPKSAYLKPSEVIDIKISFKTMNLGNTVGVLLVSFETGEKFEIRLFGETHLVSVELEKQQVRFQDTYNTMVRQQIFKIHNKSPHLLSYLCLKNECVYQDFEEKVKIATMYHNVKELETAKTQRLVQYDVVSSEEHERVYNRIFIDEIQSLVVDESLLFQSPHFSISPVKGQLWPNKVTELTVTFSPTQIGEFQCVAYLDFDGEYERLPLMILGSSLPPCIHLNIETLDMDNVYINKTYNYEVVVVNRGQINGVVTYKKPEPLFGSKIDCAPQLHCLRPGDNETFVISFRNSNQGPFFEEVNFLVRDTNVELKLYLKGEVVYPSLMFSLPCLDFGNISLGVPKTLSLDIINESVVEVDAMVKISSDGPEINSLTLADFAVDNEPKPEIPQWPKEFCIRPSKICLGPESRMTLEVTLNANLVRANQTFLELELEKSDSPPIVLPVVYRASVPEIVPAPDINLRACFIGHIYEQDVYVTTKYYWGYFTVETPNPEEKSDMQVDVRVKEGVIEPNKTIHLPLTIKTEDLGVHEYSVKIKLFGLSSPIEVCRIIGCGVRPIVTLTPVSLQWGQVKLLTVSQKALTLLNDSPVTVYFKANLLNRDGRWQVHPAEGHIDPESDTEVILTLYLIDADSYTNKLVLQLQKVKDIVVPLSATGTGTSIVVGDHKDHIELGRHYTKIKLYCNIIIENCGTRMHTLEWSEHYKAPKAKPRAAAFFNIEPKNIKLAAGEKIELSITGTSPKASFINETWYLVGSVEGINKKELLLECPITAEFVDPKIELSTTAVDLQYDNGPYSEFYKLTDIISIKNVSKLPLHIEICVKPPFAIIFKESYKILSTEESFCHCICYRAEDLNVNNIIKESGHKQSKILIDYLTLKPVEPLKTVPLHFFQDINKIKMAFNFTHCIEERLEDQETMKLQILFDTTKHNNLKSKLYCDLMRIRFRGHKNKDSIKLLGKINFPNICIITQRVDFQCVINDSLTSKTIRIQNLTPLFVCYRLLWKKYFLIENTPIELPFQEFSTNTSSKGSEKNSSLLSGTEICEILSTHTPSLQINSPTVHEDTMMSTKHSLKTPVCSTLLEGENKENIIKKVLRKVQPMITGDRRVKFDWMYKFPKKIKPTSVNFNEVMEIVPHRGMLKPDEVQLLQVIFRPLPNITVRAILECEVLGGPSETVIVTGQSSQLVYKINTHKVNFKLRSFHENAVESLMIKNLSYLPFEYAVYLNEPLFENDLDATILEVIPNQKIVEPEEEAALNIVMRPGIVGYFNRRFLLQIGYLPHIPIEIYGWGCIPQIYLSLARPGIADLPITTGYFAIPAISFEYLSVINDIFSKDVPENLQSRNIRHFFRDADFDHQWHVVSYWDVIPSVMDIELAIERWMVKKYVLQRPEVLNPYYSNSCKTGPIPGFHTIPYLIDYGVVITGSTVNCSAEVINYGPIPAKIYLSKTPKIPTWLCVKLCGKLNPGESGKIEVTFAPTPDDFIELEQHVETTIHIEVPYGVTIPVQIKALCAVPYLATNIKSIDFGLVRCGDKVVCTIPLKNIGKPTCIWYVTLKLKAHGSNPITILTTSGKYEPGEGGWLSLAFKPIMEMTYDGLLIFRFHMNPRKLALPITGIGIFPLVHIIGPNVCFPPTLPWAERAEVYFGLTNPCSFPIELIMAHSDKKWQEEHDIFRTLSQYYENPEEILVPLITPGHGLPSEIVSFFGDLMHNVKSIMQKQEAEHAATGRRPPTSRAQIPGSSRKGKSPKEKGKTATKEKVSSPVKKIRTEGEIIADEMTEMRKKNVDPLKDCCSDLEKSSIESVVLKRNKGIVIFFHGSPCEEEICQQMAYSVGKSLGLPTVSIDSCLIEALCTCKCQAKDILMGAIEDLNKAIRKSDEKGQSSEVREEQTEENHAEAIDMFDYIRQKIEVLADYKSPATPRSKASEKKKKKSPNSSISSQAAVTAIGSTTLFNMDLLTELLAEYFSFPKFDRGLVFDSLNSVVFNSPSLVMTTVLRCKSNISNHHLVLCQSEFSKWAQNYEETLRESEVMDEEPSKEYTEKEIEEIIRVFDDMDVDEYEAASEELKSVYVNHGLHQRRQRHSEKRRFQLTDLKAKEYKNKKEPSSIAVVDSKKKMKKEEPKAKLTSEYILMNTRYNEYTKNTYESLISVACNWVTELGDVGYPLYGLTGHPMTGAQKKTKKKSDIQMPVSELTIEEKGFPLTLINCPCLNYKEGLIKLFKEAPVVKQALKEDEERDILKCPVKRKNYTVLLPKTLPELVHEDPLEWHYLKETPIKKCECNQLTNLDLLDDSTQDNVLNILSKWHCTCGIKLISSQTSTTEVPTTGKTSDKSEEFGVEHTSYPFPVCQVESSTDLKDRIVLFPGDLVRCKYTFSPRDEGHFSVKRFVEVSGWPKSRVEISVVGICDLPRLDSRPKKMFDSFTRRTIEGVIYKATYLDDQKVFEIGPIFIGSARVYEEKYPIYLKNASLLACIVEVESLEEHSVFQIDKTAIQLEPGCRDKLTLSAAPYEVGVFETTVLFCVKDNPEIVAVNIRCCGVVPVIDILPLSKTIDYGKLLLYRREDDRFIVKNDSILPVLWKIRNVSEYKEDFILGQTSGIVARYDNQVIPVTYIACQVEVVHHKPLIIDVYDFEGRGDPMVVDTLYISAECYDVMVEWAYENPTESFLNYGNVKVNSTVSRQMYLLNRGKYNIFFKLKKVKNFPEPSLLKSLLVTPEYGQIPSSLKLVTLEFECTPTTSMNLLNVPAYICSLLDGTRNQVVVAKFPVCVTISAFYNTFTLFPLGELNFHIIPVGSDVTRDVVLNNTSKCPVTYEIVLPEKYQPDPDAPLTPVKVKDNKLKNPPLKCGNFLIMNDDNLLAPGTSRTLQIRFLATAARQFEETINFVISDTCPAEAQGVPLKLVGTGAMPALDFWNIETTFREHLIVNNLSDYKVPESSPHCIFAENSVTLHFFCVTVNTSFTGTIDLYNNGLVACALTMKLHYQSNSSSDVFSLDKYETHIEPLMHRSLGIIFSPKTLQEYRAVLEIKLKLLSSQVQSFKICLIGEGVIPRIQMISPPTREHRMSLLVFPVTCLGSSSVIPVKFKNISPVNSIVSLDVTRRPYADRDVFWLTSPEDSEHIHLLNDIERCNTNLKLSVKPGEVASVNVNFSPLKAGKMCCEVKLSILQNQYEYFTVLCEAESFIEDVILIGLDMLPMDLSLEAYKSSREGTLSTVSTTDSKKKKQSFVDKKTSRSDIKSKKLSQPSLRHPLSQNSLLKYILDFGGCQLGALQKRSIIMLNNSERVYKFDWNNKEYLHVRPSVGYISPGEEKDLEIMFYSAAAACFHKECMYCSVQPVGDDSLAFDLKGTTWDNRQTITTFQHNQQISLNERVEEVLTEQAVHPSDTPTDSRTIVIVYSAKTEYTKYSTNLSEHMKLMDTFIYKTRNFSFNVHNSGKVPMKIAWNFQIDEDFPARIDKYQNEGLSDACMSNDGLDKENIIAHYSQDDAQAVAVPPNKKEAEESKVTLFSGSMGRDSVDTWFEIDLPFTVEPNKECLLPNQTQTFMVSFSPLDAFDYKVRLISTIDYLDPYDQNISCLITAKSLIPYCHLDIEESDYLTSGRRKAVGLALPPNTTVLEFNLLGWGCYKKSFNVINPTSEAYDFIFEAVPSDKPELVPVHCDTLKGYVEGGSSTKVTFTFAPTAPGVYECQWKFIIPVYNLVINLLVAGIVREPEVLFVPTICVIRNSLVGFTSVNTVMLKNNENESLKFEFKGNSLCNESGKTPVVIQPDKGELKHRSETPINIIYTPIQDGPLSFKIFCNIEFKTNLLTLCVNALSYSINPKVLYYLIGNQHILNSEALTNIHLDKTASTYERTIPFVIKNEGSATFFYDWHYNTASVKKYLQVNIEPRNGHVQSGCEVECTLYFTLKQIPVKAFPITLSISDGPTYKIQLFSEIEKPLYHFSCMEYDFGKCIMNAPDTTYKKNFAFYNDDSVPIIVGLNFSSIAEMFVDFNKVAKVAAGKKCRIPIYFRPKAVQSYEFKLQFWVNTLCEEIITIRGQGVPLLFDLFEGCQKSFDLGPVKVGEKIIRQIEVMNYSQVPIDATFIFKDMYPVIEDTTNSGATSACLTPTAPSQSSAGLSRVTMLQNFKDEKVREQMAMDMKNALTSVKVVPPRCTIKPYMKIPLKIQFKPVGIISKLNIQLNMKVLEFERPLVRLSGSATGMSLRLSQSSIQFGRVRKRSVKILKVLLQNQGDFGTRFWWQPLISDEFIISPLQGNIAAHTNVTFTITFRPMNHNPYIKVWASCNIDNYIPLELAMYASCVEMGEVITKNLYFEVPVREVSMEHVTVINPSDDMWLVFSELSGASFETLNRFELEPNSTFDIPISFKPKTIGHHEGSVLYLPLGDTALMVHLNGAALHPSPNGSIKVTVTAKEVHNETLFVHNLTEFPETYIISTEVVKIVPEKFDGYYEIKCPENVKVWGEATATCTLSFVCFDQCEMQLKVMFINEVTREYQFYNITVTVTACDIVDTLLFVSPARESVLKEIKISNPLSDEAVFNVRSESLQCTSSLNIGRKSEVLLSLTYSPLVVGESEEFLEVYNELAGLYVYRVILKCLPAKEKEMEFSTPLGTKIPLRLKVQNKTEAKTEFTSKISKPSIIADEMYSLGPLEKGKFLVWFEPTKIGEQTIKVSFESPIAGEFVFKIKGTGKQPKPQGPYVIKSGGHTTIKFKNIFEDKRTFSVYTDCEDFRVDESFETIEKKTEISIPVSLSDKATTENNASPTGCLTVECYDPDSPPIQWTYFLQGIL